MPKRHRVKSCIIQFPTVRPRSLQERHLLMCIEKSPMSSRLLCTTETRQNALESHNIPTSALQQAKETKQSLHSDLLKVRIPLFFQIDVTFLCHFSVDRTSPTSWPIEQRRVLGAMDGWIAGWLAECLAGYILRWIDGYNGYATYLPTYLPTYLATYLPTYLPIYIYICMYIIYISIWATKKTLLLSIILVV